MIAPGAAILPPAFWLGYCFRQFEVMGHKMLDTADADFAQDEMLKLDNQLCFGLYAATHAITRVYRPMLNELGITYSQFLVLLSLWERDGQTVSALGESLYLDSGTLSPVLKRLEAGGLVAKTRQSRDERVVEVSLTQKGRDLKTQAREVRTKVRCRLGMDEAEIARLRQDLNVVLAALAEDGAIG